MSEDTLRPILSVNMYVPWTLQPAPKSIRRLLSLSNKPYSTAGVINKLNPFLFTGRIALPK